MGLQNKIQSLRGVFDGWKAISSSIGTTPQGGWARVIGVLSFQNSAHSYRRAGDHNTRLLSSGKLGTSFSIFIKIAPSAVVV